MQQLFVEVLTPGSTPMLPPGPLLSRPAQDVLAILLGASAAQAPMPRNSELAAQAGWRRATVREALSRLARQGIIQLEAKNGLRRCFVVDTEAWTGWSELRLPPPPPPPEHITEVMDNILRVIVRAANTGAEMPNNPELGTLAGGRGRSSALRGLRRLVRAGAVLLEHQDRLRRVQVCETGRWTGWGEARPGHVPFIHRQRGTPGPSAIPTKPRVPDSKPLPTARPPSEPLSEAFIARSSLPVAAAATCQFLVSPETRSRWAAPLFCGEPSQDGCSYCATHQAVCYPNGRRQRPTAGGARRVVCVDRVLHSLADGEHVSGDRLYSSEALFG